MILWAALVMSHWCLGPSGAAAGSTGLERIEGCGTRCSQGLHCKNKPDPIFPPPCQTPAEGLDTFSVFHNISLSPVMRCEGRQKCSLHLRIKAKLQLHESVHGVSICATATGMMGSCRIFSFTRASRERMSGQQVELENDCTDISPGQQVRVTVKTVPSYCGITWTATYEAPGCVREDLRRHVPECITGRLSYDVHPQKRELSVRVSDMLEDYSYHLRLCRRKDFICAGTGVNKLIKKEEPVKSVILPYSRPLPCLCIEGWSAVMDAPRVQVCPFTDRLEELWSEITFDPLAGILSWEPACPVTAVVALCQEREDGGCVDLPHSSQNVSREKMTFTEVDPHPQLCMKFTAGSQSWTKCPFANGRFQAWEIVVMRKQGHEDVQMSSQINATFSVGLCVKSEGSAGCQVTETHTVHVAAASCGCSKYYSSKGGSQDKRKAVGLNLAGKLCGSCLQVTRLDVKFAATVKHCLKECDPSTGVEPIISRQASWDMTWVVVPAGVCLSGIIIITLLLHALLTVYQRRKQESNGDCSSEKPTGPSFECAVPAFQAQPVLHGGVLIPDALQYGNTEKANLISN